MDERLNILQTFTSPLLQMPRGMAAVTEDQVLICSSDNDSLVELQLSTNTMSTILRKGDYIRKPYSLAYCPDQKKLFLASKFTNTIKVYHIT